jgi:dipeptidyl aminopeptidase/acylaminoacyl peptidase
MYRRDLRDTDFDGLLADMAVADAAVQALPAPSGDRIAYAKDREGQVDLWLLEDGADSRLTPDGVLAMRYGRDDPRWFDWSPNGDRIVYVDADGTATTVDVETGATRALTRHDAADLAVAWSPDGDDIAVVTDAFSRRSLAFVGPGGDRIEAVADDEYLYGAPRWYGRGVIATRSTHRDLFDYEAGLVGADRESVETLFTEEAVRAASPRPRPGHQQVAFVHDASGYDAVYLTDGAAVREVYAIDGAEVADPAWHDDGDRLAVTVTEDATVSVHVVDVAPVDDLGAVDPGEPLAEGVEVAAEGDHHTAPRWDGDDLLAVADTPARPPAVRNLGFDYQVTPAGVVGLDERVPAPETTTYESGDREVQAVVYPPAADASTDSVPLLVKPHGGPTSFDRLGFDHRAAYFAALGYAVVLPNYRGSDGYGRAFRMANDGDWGGEDLADVVRAADAVADRYDAVDGSRAGIFGGSGGGLMTVNALCRSDRFLAGAAFYGVYDYESFVDDTDDVGWQLMKRELGDLSTDLANYRDASPLRHVEELEAPLLVLHGEDDARVPISQSEQLVAKLESHRKRYEFQRYEGEPHGFGKRENVVDAYTRVADLFAKYLGTAPDDGSSRPHHGNDAENGNGNENGNEH